MQTAGQQHRNKDWRGDGKDKQALAPAAQPPAQKGGQRHDQCDLEHPENIAVKARVPVADRAAEHPVRDRPELAAGVVVMGQEVRKGMQETGASEGAQDELFCAKSLAQAALPR